MNKSYTKDVESFSFTGEATDEDIFNMCEDMGIPEREAYTLIDIRDKYIVNYDEKE